MTLIPDALILLIVYALAGLYTASVYTWLESGRRSDEDALDGSERLGLSIVLGVLLLAIANNYISPLLGSVWTGVALLTIPLCHVCYVAFRRGPPSPFRALLPTLGRDAAALIFCAVFVLCAAHKLFFWRSLSASGLFYPDLPWHIGRVAEQAFQSSPGFWPLSPLAFPGPLPFVSFVADSLVSATFRYLPMPIQAFNYTQVLFGWSLVFWGAVVLVAGSGLKRSLIVLTTAFLAVPVLLFGIGKVGFTVVVFFLANPNSLTAWPIALALAFHLHRSFRRNAPPSRLLLVLVPPASIFFKANQALAFGFLQLLGFAIWLSFGRSREALRWGVYAVGIWTVTVLASLGMGPWPISPGIHPSIDNLWYYMHVALPQLNSWQEVMGAWLTYALVVAVVCAAAALLRSDSCRSLKAVGRALRHDVVIPVAGLLASMAYLLVVWWVIPPSGVGEGEPMHVTFELIMWLVTVGIAAAVCSLDEGGDPPGRLRRLRAFASAAASSVALAASVFLVWSLNTQPYQRGGIPLYFDYDIAVEARVRDLVRAWIPDGNCFWYGRRYAVYAGDPYDPDTVIAATGCPVINGRRWRGYLGNNRPELLKGRPTIEGQAGGSFRLVEIGTSWASRQIADLEQRIAGGERFQTRPELMALARVMSVTGAFKRDALRQVLTRTDETPEIREPLALIRAEIDGRRRHGLAGPDVVQAGAGVVMSRDMNGDARLEGFTVHVLPTGEREVLVYFTPRRDWNGRRVWMHAYPPESHVYINIDPIKPTFDGWKPDELGWEVFRLPADVPYNVYVGVEGDWGSNLGSAFPLGPIGAASSASGQIVDLEQRIAGGGKFQTRPELMALARVMSVTGAFKPDALRQVLARTDKTPELREPLALIRAELDGRRRRGLAGPDVIHAGAGVVVSRDMNGDARLEGFTVHVLPTGEREVLVYFTPRRDWNGRRVWMHAYPPESHVYINIDPIKPTVDGWRPGELAWEAFRLPANARYIAYVGVEGGRGSSLGSAYLLGSIGPAPCSAPPPAPGRLTTIVAGSMVKLVWNPSPGAASYAIEAGSTTGASDRAVLETGNSHPQFVVPRVDAGTYFVRIRARNPCGTSRPSNETIARVP